MSRNEEARMIYWDGVQVISQSAFRFIIPGTVLKEKNTYCISPIFKIGNQKYSAAFGPSDMPEYYTFYLARYSSNHPIKLKLSFEQHDGKKIMEAQAYFLDVKDGNFEIYVIPYIISKGILLEKKEELLRFRCLQIYVDVKLDGDIKCQNGGVTRQRRASV